MQQVSYSFSYCPSVPAYPIHLTIFRNTWHVKVKVKPHHICITRKLLKLTRLKKICLSKEAGIILLLGRTWGLELGEIYLGFSRG